MRGVGRTLAVLEDLLDEPEEDIRGKRSLMGLVEDDVLVAADEKKRRTES